MSEPSSKYEIEDQVLRSLKKRDGVVTAGDVAADTGLGYADVESALRSMLSEYKSHLDVDDDGNLRYRFDSPIIRRGEQPGRLWHDIKAWSWSAFKWTFKVWIMITLVGYTVIFILLLLALAIASIAAAVSSDSDIDDGFIGLPFYFLARVLEVVFWISIFDDSHSRGRRRMGRSRRRKPKPEKAFYQRIFDFVFGPEQKSDPLDAQRTFTRFVRYRGGVVSAAEWASRTGQSLEAAENALTAGLMRFDGDATVTSSGHLLYRFDALRVTAHEGESEADVPPIWTRRKVLPSLTGNTPSTNWWIGGLNLFNLAMAFTVLAVLPAEMAVDPLITYGLGWVPLAFSAMLFAVPLARRVKRIFDERKVEQENQRRAELARVYKAARERGSTDLDEAWADTMIRDYEGDIDVDDSGNMAYTFEELGDELEAARKVRERDDSEVVFGATVFSSDEEEKSLEQSELDEFDRKLAVELGVEETVSA